MIFKRWLLLLDLVTLLLNILISIYKIDIFGRIDVQHGGKRRRSFRWRNGTSILSIKRDYCQCRGEGVICVNGSCIQIPVNTIPLVVRSYWNQINFVHDRLSSFIFVSYSSFSTTLFSCLFFVCVSLSLLPIISVSCDPFLFLKNFSRPQSASLTLLPSFAVFIFSFSHTKFFSNMFLIQLLFPSFYLAKMSRYSLLSHCCKTSLFVCFSPPAQLVPVICFHSHGFHSLLTFL